MKISNSGNEKAETTSTIFRHSILNFGSWPALPKRENQQSVSKLSSIVGPCHDGTAQIVKQYEGVEANHCLLSRRI